MRQLKSFSNNLRKLVTENITAWDIAEHLVSFDAERDAASVAAFMTKKDFDHIGVRRDGLVVGYAVRTALTEGLLGDHLVSFEIEDLVPARTPLLDTLDALGPLDDPGFTPRVFVTAWDKPGGIVTFGDMQKAPVRMWLFGLITLTEMQMLRIIRAYYPDDCWRAKLRTERLEYAERILEDRRRRNEGVDLADCLQFCDKRELIVRDEALRQRLGATSRRQLEKDLVDLEHLRDDLAHAQDILVGRRETLLPLARKVTDMLRRWEDTKVGDIRAA